MPGTNITIEPLCNGFLNYDNTWQLYQIIASYMQWGTKGGSDGDRQPGILVILL